MSKHLHIISFDIPFPANYGGVIDVYYKLMWLHKTGIKIHLHCFEYGRKHALELEQWCETVTYYKRNTGFISHLSMLPYTVRSRMNKQLKRNLLKDNHPILCEVLHTCWIMNEPEFRNRFMIYRHSNIEHDYYNALASAEKDLLKKTFLRLEALRLKRFERTIGKASLILAVNEKDTAYFQKKYPGVNTHYLPSFHANAGTSIKPGTSKFALFHGNLSVAENADAAKWLIKNVFSAISQKVIIAGLRPKQKLRDLIDKYEHIELIPDPTDNKMNELIETAQQHVLYTKQTTGLKLKLLNVLFKGRHIICNSLMLEGSGVSPNSSILVKDTAKEMIEALQDTLEKELTETQLQDRIKTCQHFSNQENAKKIVAFLP